jgi:hypothetical protein
MTAVSMFVGKRRGQGSQKEPHFELGLIKFYLTGVRET